MTTLLQGDVTVKGLPEVQIAFKTMTIDLQENAAKAAVGAAARNTAKVASSRAPTGVYKGRRAAQAGTLKRAIIGHWSPKRSKAYRVHVGLVRARSGKREQRRKSGSRDAYYAGWVEFGHRNVPRFKGKYDNFVSRGLGRLTGISIRRRFAAARERAGVENARTKPHPFLAPAWAATQTAALRIITATLQRFVKRHNKRRRTGR